VPAESIRPDRLRTAAIARTSKLTCSYVAVYRFCAKDYNFGGKRNRG